MPKRIFISENSPLLDEYYAIIEDQPTEKELYLAMKKLIKKDPNFFDPYTIVYQYLWDQRRKKEALKVLDTGYELALKMILDEDGLYPDVLDYSQIENRHILRILLNKGIAFWEANKRKKALDIFRQMLLSDTDDRIGVRFYIPAILENFSHFDYQDIFEYDGVELHITHDWFDKHHHKYPEEFSFLG